MAFVTSNWQDDNKAVTTSGSFVDDRDSDVSIGLLMPLNNDSGVGYFGTTKTTLLSVKENIRMLIQTELGERLMQPNLGIALRRYLFEQFTPEVGETIRAHIVDSFGYWLPFVDIQQLDVSMAEDEGWSGGVGKNALTVFVKFNIKKDPNSSDSIQVNIER